MRNQKLIRIQNLIRRVNANKTGIFRRDSELIAILPKEIASVIGDDKIHISEFIVAKIKGRINELNNHPEITNQMFLRIPRSLSQPFKILKDTRNREKYLFINNNPLHEIVVEISRNNSDKSEINTMHIIDSRELKRLEHKFPAVYSSGETPNFSHACL